jgi:Leucine-rich repeat (LRR) protein
LCILYAAATIIAEETAFAGDIPRLPDNLVNFDISFSFFTGGLTDANFEGLNQMNFIDLDGNAFNSTVPSVFGRLPNLEFLYLSDAFISGDLSYMNGMSAMREHWIDTNPGLSGPVFDFIGSISTLESLSVTFSALTGTLPTTLGNLAAMQQMWLYSNQLTGQIPATLGNLAAMRILQLEGNSFTGSMPAEVCANTQFPTMVIEVLGADCEDPSFTCACCTCCSVLECNG